MHTFHVDGLAHSLRVVRFTGHESISQPFQLEITVVCDDHELSSGSVVGRSATFAIHVGDGSQAVREPRVIHGVVSRFAHGDTGKARTAYRVTLVPALSSLRLRVDSRIFQGLTVPQIVADVLLRSGFPPVEPQDRERRDRVPVNGYQMTLVHAYRPREYCVQYRESDWDFILRLLEEEGLHYVFEHDESAHYLVISDAPTGHAPLTSGARIPLRPGAGALAPEEHVSRFHFVEEVRPARVVVSDYSFERPGLSLEARAQTGGDLGSEVFEHPGDYDVPAVGSSVAQLRLEELQASRWAGEGDSNSARLLPGRTFWLTEHPCAELNRGYLITRVEHRGSEAHGEGDADTLERYSCRFEVIPADVAFRPARRTARPILPGIQTAIVVGPPGEEIHTDEHGRIKVRFHWDRSGKLDDRCSCWIRVAQASAGAAWGSMFLPRVGHEVVVDFLEGDPDRPLVTGSVYHAANVPPYVLPAEKTKSTLKTNSSPGGGGSNELRFEDLKGAEEVYLHAQKDLDIKVEDDKTVFVGGSRTAHVTGLDTETVLLAQTVTVGGAQAVTVGGLMALTVGAVKTEMVGAASIEGVGLKKSTTVGLSYSAKAGTDIKMKSLRNTSVLAVGSISEQAGTSLSLSAGHSLSGTAGTSLSLAAGQSLSGTAGHDLSLSAGQKLSLTAATTLGIEAGAGMYVEVEGNVKESATKTRTMVVGDGLTIKCGSTEIKIDKAGNVTVKASGKVKIKGTNVDING
jgi:type VI secretion system secreted protein VgrG